MVLAGGRVGGGIAKPGAGLGTGPEIGWPALAMLMQYFASFYLY